MNPDWIINGRRYDQKDLAAIAAGIEGLDRAARVLIRSSDPALYYAVLAHSERNDAFLFALPHSMPASSAVEVAQSAGVDLVIEGSAEAPRVSKPERAAAGGAETASGESGGICIFTTGTTGGPKGVVHTWQTISASSRYVPGALAGAVWWLAYQMTSYAGLQVYFSARRSAGTLVIETNRDPAAVAAAMVGAGVTVISATPTYWRWLAQAWPSGVAKPALLRATLGGEVVTQETLDLVRDTFLPQGITHIYASSEAGTAIVVSDGLAGFPAAFAGEGPGGAAECKVVDGELFVRSTSRMARYWKENEPGDGWIATGDLVEEREGRYYFRGRADGRINAGGAKVNPERVEEALERLPMIRVALVYAKSSPNVGDLLAADVEWAGPEAFDAGRVREGLTKMLAPHEIPPYIRTVDRIPMSENGKKVRV
ncbi:MAG: AMP-binding protein [Gemmatimonadetes bacterium]|nr:AMP-binding protein [Gemmatimonadota bacterium]